MNIDETIQQLKASLRIADAVKSGFIWQHWSDGSWVDQRQDLPPKFYPHRKYRLKPIDLEKSGKAYDKQHVLDSFEPYKDTHDLWWRYENDEHEERHFGLLEALRGFAGMIWSIKPKQEAWRPGCGRAPTCYVDVEPFIGQKWRWNTWTIEHYFVIGGYANGYVTGNDQDGTANEWQMSSAQWEPWTRPAWKLGEPFPNDGTFEEFADAVRGKRFRQACWRNEGWIDGNTICLDHTIGQTYCVYGVDESGARFCMGIGPGLVLEEYKEPKYRPWKTVEEVPIGAIVRSRCGKRRLQITGAIVDKNNDLYLYHQLGNCNTSIAHEYYTMDDGSPCVVRLEDGDE